MDGERGGADEMKHAKRKRILADRYANSNIMRGSAIAGVQERSRRFVERCTSSGTQAHDTFMALHAYACDCITHHLFHPRGTNCLQDKGDEDMMHQVAADDSLQSKQPRVQASLPTDALCRSTHLLLQSSVAQNLQGCPVLLLQTQGDAAGRQLRS